MTRLMLLMVCLPLAVTCAQAASEAQSSGSSGADGGASTPAVPLPTPAAPDQAQVSDVIRTRRLEIVDRDGKVRGAFDSTSDGSPTLMLYDKNGQARIGLDLSESVSCSISTLVLYDELGHTRATLSAIADVAVFTLFDEKGNDRLTIKAMDGEGATVSLADREGSEALTLSLEAEERPYLALRNKEGKSRALLEIMEDGNPRLVLWDKNGAAYSGSLLPSLASGLPSVPSGGLSFMPASPGLYSGTGGGHWIKKVVDRGKIIILEDGSTWEIAMLDRLNTGLWLPISSIVVTRSDNALYPYLLVNKNDKHSAEAKLLAR